MLSTRLSTSWTKILNDLWGHKTRTILIVLSITVGLLAVGTIASARIVLSEEMARSFAAIHPSSGTVRTVELFEEDFVQSVRRMPGVADADARRGIAARIRTDGGEWQNITLFAVDDYDAMRLNVVRPHAGAWPPPEREILIERAALQVLGAEIGEAVYLEMPSGQNRKLLVAGTTYDLSQLPAQIDNLVYGYVSFATLEWLGEEYGFNELHVAAPAGFDKKSAQAVVNAVKNRAERTGYTIPMSMTADPGQVPLDDILQAVLFLMGALGVLALLLSAFLIVNTVSALLAQQRRQIGVMKAIGARTSQIMRMYLTMVLIYGVFALLVAIPASIAGSLWLSRFLADMFNFDLERVQFPVSVVILQVVIGLLVPVLAALPPFLANLRVSAVEAMTTLRLGRGHFGAGLIDRLLAGHNLWFARRLLPRTQLLSLRNIFRSKARLALTLSTLTLAGATFIGVFSVNASLNRSVDELVSIYNFDTMVIFDHPYRLEKIVAQTEAVPGVARADGWIQVPVRRIRPDGSEGGMIYLFAPRVGSDLVPGPAIVEGRWLVPEDENAIVVDAIMRKDEPDLDVGDELVLKIGGRERSFRIVGFSLGIVVPMTYANYPYVAELTGRVGRADTALVQTVEHDIDTVREVNGRLEHELNRNGLQVTAVGTIAAEREEGKIFFGVLVSLLLVMALLLALVGGLGLMGTMSINVLERTREIGVLRAIGAPSRGVSQVFVREGIAIGVLSWAFGALLAYPLGKALATAVWVPLMGAEPSFTYSVNGVWIWLALVVILSGLASFLPARNAARLTVRQVLAYE